MHDNKPTECAFTDACDDAAGDSFGLDWFYLNWNQDWPEATKFHINEKEIEAAVLAAYRWAPRWKNKRVVIHCDNSVTVVSLNKCTSRSDIIMKCLRSLFWLSATYNYHLTSKYIPGIFNIAADSASRLHLPGYLETLQPFTCHSPLQMHMSSKISCFCLADSGNGLPANRLQQTLPTKTQAPPPDLSTTLDEDVQMSRSTCFVASTWRTYSAQLSASLDFCGKLNISPAPISQLDIGRYIAFLSRRLYFSSIRQYLNVRLIHLDSGLKNPLEQNWYVASILKGVRRVKGNSSLQKLPITFDILRAIFMKLDLKCSFERSFWTACLVTFFCFFRKSNLLVQSHILFDPSRHLCASDVEFTQDRAVLTVRWSKVIQLRSVSSIYLYPEYKTLLFAPHLPF